jgi:hypothetical protein
LFARGGSDTGGIVIIDARLTIITITVSAVILGGMADVMAAGVDRRR